jgi:hypothetical protein
MKRRGMPVRNDIAPNRLEAADEQRCASEDGAVLPRPAGAGPDGRASASGTPARKYSGSKAQRVRRPAFFGCGRRTTDFIARLRGAGISDHERVRQWIDTSSSA